MEPEPQGPKRRLNPTAIALLGIAVLLLIVWFFSAGRDPDQDKLTGPQASQAEPSGSERLCSSKATYDQIKRELFRRAAQVRGGDQAVFDRLSGYAVVRMENPVMESEDSATGTVNCSGSLSLDLPPGVAVAGGRRTLSANVDYQVGTGGTLALGNADAIVTPLATLARVAEAPQPVLPPDSNMVAPVDPLAPIPDAAPPAQPSAPRPVGARPSFDCANARSRGEIQVCSDAGLATLDRNMAAQYGRSLAVASPEQRAILRQTRDRFLAFRDRCPTRACIGDAYTGRMREIRDIMEGRWQPPR